MKRPVAKSYQTALIGSDSDEEANSLQVAVTVVVEIPHDILLWAHRRMTAVRVCPAWPRVHPRGTRMCAKISKQMSSGGRMPGGEKSRQRGRRTIGDKVRTWNNSDQSLEQDTE